MGRAHSIHGRDVTFVATVAREHNRRDHLGDLRMNGRLTLKYTNIISDQVMFM
jgi:hypothetical protein